MRLTLAHARFWQTHRGPQWARLSGATAAHGVHACINEHAAPTDTHAERHAMNTVRLVIMMRRRQPLRDVVAQLAHTPNFAPVADPRRRARCEKWLQRMEQRTGA